MPVRLAPVALAFSALANAAAASPPAPAHLGISPAILPVHEGHGGAAQASGTVNAVDPARHTVNLSHGSIKALGWPAMTMDFPVGPDVDLTALKPGMRVSFTLVHGNGGMVVDTIRPAGGGQ